MCPVADCGTLAECPTRRREIDHIGLIKRQSDIRMAIQIVFVDDANDRRDVHEIVCIYRGQLCQAVLGLSRLKPRKSLAAFSRFSPCV
jgi:hypothetical protein